MTKTFISRGDVLILKDFYASDFVDIATYYGFSLQDFDIGNVVRKDLELKKHNFIQIATPVGHRYFYIQKTSRKYETALYVINSEKVVIHHGLRICEAF